MTVLTAAEFGPPGPDGLWDAERLLLTGLRAWARCRVEHREPARLVSEGLASVTSDRVGALFSAVMQAIEAGGRRALRVHCGACPGYAEDEQRLVLACGLAPIEPQMAMQLLAPLVRDAGPVVCFAAALNAALAQEGFALPVRLSDPAPTAGLATIH
jgi:hypothetical protein